MKPSFPSSFSTITATAITAAPAAHQSSDSVNQQTRSSWTVEDIFFLCKDVPSVSQYRVLFVLARSLRIGSQSPVGRGAEGGECDGGQDMEMLRERVEIANRARRAFRSLAEEDKVALALTTFILAGEEAGEEVGF